MQPAAMPTAIDITIWKNFITMPSTAMGIWANCSWPNIGSSAPYLSVMFCMAAMAATSDICDRKLHMPSGRNLRARRPLNAKLRRLSFTAFMWHRYHMASAAVTTWPSTVATAAPIMPQRNTNMNSGSNMMLSTAPASVDAIAKRGLPSERMMGLSAWPNT